VSTYTKSVIGPLYGAEGNESVNAIELVVLFLFDCVEELVQVKISGFFRLTPSYEPLTELFTE
jgi:hypothetical protein